MGIRQLHEVLEKTTASVPFRPLQRAAVALSTGYRQDGTAGPGEFSALDAQAYAATRMPATSAAVRTVLQELRWRCGADLQVTSGLDLGAGTGAASWAAIEEFSTLRQLTCVERDREMVRCGRLLADAGSWPSCLETTWCEESLLARSPYARHDLVMAAYVLGELNDRLRSRVVEAAWGATEVAFVAVLPGSTEGYRAMLDVRAQLLELGATLVAPCPHDRRCPLLDLDDGEWCHVATRVQRSSLHRRLKHGQLPYEDEKFIYVIATRGYGSPAQARVIRRPTFGGRHVVLHVCGTHGLKHERVPRSRRAEYRRARKVRWGDAWTGDRVARPPHDG